MDINSPHVSVDGLPAAPEGKQISRIDVIVRLRDA